MKRTGRPQGTGCDDLLRIVRIRRHMTETGSSRRAAIIELFGYDQLRRLEKKMAAMDPSEIPVMLEKRLGSARTQEAIEETIHAFSDEGFLVLGPFLWGGVVEHLESNTLNPFAPA